MPRGEQRRDGEPRAGAREQHAGRVKGDKVAVAAPRRNPPRQGVARAGNTEAGGDDDHSVGGKQLDVYPDPGAELSLAAPADLLGGGRVKSQTAADRARLAFKRSYRGRGPRPWGARVAAGAEHERAQGRRQRPWQSHHGEATFAGRRSAVTGVLT